MEQYRRVIVPNEKKGRRDAPSVLVYVDERCPLCAEARRLAARIQRKFPAVEVRVIDLDAATTSPPAIENEIFSVPTWVLDGRTLSLGNPSMDTLQRVVTAALSEFRRNRT